MHNYDVFKEHLRAIIRVLLRETILCKILKDFSEASSCALNSAKEDGKDSVGYNTLQKRST